MIKVFVQKTMAKADIDTPLTSGSVGLEVEFVFSEDWSGLTKTAVFETSSFYKETAPLSTSSTIVPADVMAWEDETLYIGVYGTAQNGEIVIPTVYANCGRIHKGANDSEGGRPLIPAQSDILQNQIDSLGGRVAWLEATGGGGGGAGILLDTTLTKPGMAADAKAVGDALSKIETGGGSADLTGYATEEWVKAGYQPKGNYATKNEIPTVPTKLSAFTNDAGFVTEDALENLGGKAYVQNTQPANMEEGEFWYNPDEEPEGGESSGGGGGAFALLADIDCSQVSGNIVLTDLADLTEIYVEWNGVQNSHASTASGYRLKINDVYLGIHQFIPIQKSGSNLYGWSYAKCVGVAWIAQRSAGAVALDNEQLSNGNAMFPYNTIKTGAANKLVFGAPDTQYQAVAGTIKIWGR